MDIDACAPQDTAKDHQVFEKTGHRPGRAFHVSEALRAIARSSRSAARRPRSASRSSFAFSTTPRVSSIASASRDRKSTRLNSSHLVISYAVFCLKKKKYETDTSDVGTS